jgi:hypothetical protein
MILNFIGFIVTEMSRERDIAFKLCKTKNQVTLKGKKYNEKKNLKQIMAHII